MKAFIKKAVLHEVEIAVSGTDIAELLWSLDETGQAEFFNHLGTKPQLSDQLAAVTRSKKLANTGRSAMWMIGEFSHP